MKDEAAGEVPVAFVVRSNGSKISEDDIKQYISKQVPIDQPSSIAYIKTHQLDHLVKCLQYIICNHYS